MWEGHIREKRHGQAARTLHSPSPHHRYPSQVLFSFVVKISHPTGNYVYSIGGSCRNSAKAKILFKIEHEGWRFVWQHCEPLYHHPSSHFTIPSLYTDLSTRFCPCTATCRYFVCVILHTQQKEKNDKSRQQQFHSSLPDTLQL